MEFTHPLSLIRKKSALWLENVLQEMIYNGKLYKIKKNIYDRISNKIWIFKKILRLCLVIVFVFYFQKLVFGNIKKKQFSCIFEIKNMFG